MRIYAPWDLFGQDQFNPLTHSHSDEDAEGEQGVGFEVFHIGWFFLGWGLLNVCGDHIFAATVGDTKANPRSLCVVRIEIPCSARTDQPFFYGFGACRLPASLNLAHHINHRIERTAGINPEVVCVLPHEALDCCEGDFPLGFRWCCCGCLHTPTLPHFPKLSSVFLRYFDDCL